MQEEHWGCTGEQGARKTVGMAGPGRGEEGRQATGHPDFSQETHFRGSEGPEFVEIMQPRWEAHTRAGCAD